MKILITLIIVFFGLNLFATPNVPIKDTSDVVVIPERDTSYDYIADSLNVVGEDLKSIGFMVKNEYKKLGFVGFVRTYKYFIITILIFVFLFLLWASNRK